MTNHFVENQSTLSNAAEGAKIGVVIIGIGASFLVPDPSDLLIAGVAGRMAFGMKVYRGWDDAAKYMRSVSREFGRTSGRPGTRTLQGSSDGGRGGAEKMFAKLTRGNSSPRDGGQLGRLGDGSVVYMNTRALRDGSIETSVRIQRDRPGSKIKENVKIRFKHNE